MILVRDSIRSIWAQTSFPETFASAVWASNMNIWFTILWNLSVFILSHRLKVRCLCTSLSFDKTYYYIPHYLILLPQYITENVWHKVCIRWKMILKHSWKRNHLAQMSLCFISTGYDDTCRDKVDKQCTLALHCIYCEKWGWGGSYLPYTRLAGGVCPTLLVCCKMTVFMSYFSFQIILAVFVGWSVYFY